ncbi:hypothetical protein KL919_000578 [Ogataea angusta]|nr:hypothetical protein KL943_001064 [Ogataea angusta]KAG7864550.1 hypothetical protein KL919_000578 [Ogataea angusta]
MAETVSSARSLLSAKRTALLETARKGAMDAKIMDRLVLRGVEDLAVGIEAAGNDFILVSAWIYLATPMKKEPPLDFTRNAIELFLPVSGTLRKHIERQAKLTKIDQLALDDFLDHVPIASPRELALDYLLHRDHHVLVKLCTQKMLKLVIDAAQLENEKSMLLVEMLVDQLRPLAGFDKIEHLNWCAGRTFCLETWLRARTKRLGFSLWVCFSTSKSTFPGQKTPNRSLKSCYSRLKSSKICRMPQEFML